MGSFAELCKETVYVVKPDGRKLGPYQCTLSSSSSTIFDASLDVDEGDSLWRELPNGKAETYTVLEVQFSEKFFEIPANFKLTIQKDSSLVSRQKVQSTSITISHSHGFQVGDHNTQNIVESFRTLIRQIDETDAPKKDKNEAKGRIAKVLAHPLVVAVLGGAAGGLTGTLGE